MPSNNNNIKIDSEVIGDDNSEDVIAAAPDLIPETSSGQHHDTDTESVSALSSHSSVLVDMGKVVGVLRSYPHDQLLDDDIDEDDLVNGSDFELSDDDENYLSESESPVLRAPRVCASCAQESKESEDSLIGDPLVYATFVAPVQQYSTETEPSRQPSFNSRQPSLHSRQPSFKQNSSEADQSVSANEVTSSSTFQMQKLFTRSTELHWLFIKLFLTTNY